MKADIKLKTEQGNFKFRVGGVIIVDEKVLGVQICDNGFYCLPGGHVEIGCDTKEATLRELEEEVNGKFEIKSFMSIMECFFKRKDGKEFHELGFYYLAEPKTKLRMENYTIIEKDKDEDVKLDFKWIPINELEQHDFRPKEIKEQILSGDFSFKHLIIRDWITKKEKRKEDKIWIKELVQEALS